MQLATLLVCLFTILPNDEVVNAHVERDQAKLASLSGLAEIERNLITRPNSFLYYYLAERFEEQGDFEKANQNYQRALEMLDLPSAILLLDDAGDETDFGKEIYKKIRNIKLDSGALRMPTLSQYFSQRASFLSKKGLNPEKSLKFSIELDPFQIPPRLALIGHYVRNIKPLVYTELVGLFHSFGDFSNQYFLLINLYLLTSIALTIGLFFYLIVLLIKHERSIYHSLLSITPPELPYHLRTGLAALIILVPILWKFDSLWLWLVMAVVVALFCNFREKTVLICGSILLLVAPLSSRFESKMLNVGDAFLLYRAQVCAPDWKLIDSLNTVKEERPSYGALFSIGLLEKRMGHFDAAREAYMEALEENPESSAVHNNLGNVYFAMGRFEDAAREYERAIELNPNLASAHYNLSQTYLRLMRFDRYTQEIEIANKLAFNRITEFMSNSSDHPNRAVIDELLPNRILWREVFDSMSGRLISPILQWKNSILILVGLILIISVSLVGKVIKLPQIHCSVCNAPICNKCSKIIEEEIVCSSCASKLKLTKSAGIRQKIAQRIKNRKVKFKKIAASLLSALPGMGHIYLGSVYSGFFLLLVSVYLILGIIYNGLPYCPADFVRNSSTVRLALGIIFLLLIAKTVFGILRREIEVK